MGLARQGGNHNVLRDVVIDGFKIGIGPSSQTTYENVMVDGVPYLPPVTDTVTETRRPAPTR